MESEESVPAEPWHAPPAVAVRSCQAQALPLLSDLLLNDEHMERHLQTAVAGNTLPSFANVPGDLRVLDLFREGGGVSDVFPLPSWQKAANVPPSVNPGKRKGRGLPGPGWDPRGG